MPLNAVMKISSCVGETKQVGPEIDYRKEGWIELQGWDWEVEAETSWTKGGGASVGKPSPGKMNWEHYFDTSSPNVLRNIFTGTSFDTIEMHMLKGTGKGQGVFFKMIMNGVFMTKVNQSATEEGNVVQKVEMVFKDVEFLYRPQNDVGALGGVTRVKWDISAGTVT